MSNILYFLANLGILKFKIRNKDKDSANQIVDFSISIKLRKLGQ